MGEISRLKKALLENWMYSEVSEIYGDLSYHCIHCGGDVSDCEIPKGKEPQVIIIHEDNCIIKELKQK